MLKHDRRWNGTVRLVLKEKSVSQTGDIMNPAGQEKPDVAVEFDAQPQILAVVRHFVSSLAQDLKLTPEEALQVELCVDEAGANSIDGTREIEGDDPNSVIRIEFKIEAKSLQITVIDRGKDFSKHLEKAHPLTEYSDRTKKRGYGLQIIKTFMDKIAYQHNPGSGNRLHMTKKFQ